MGTLLKLVISSVSVPLKPGSTKPAVAWTISPRRPRLDLPSMRATMSSGISTYSCVRPRTNSPGGMTNGSPGSTATSSVRLVGGSRRSIAAGRWLWKTRNEPPSLRSTEAGCTSAGSHGSMTILFSSTRRRIVPSERTEVAATARSLPPGPDRVSALELARPGAERAHPRRRERQRIAVRAAPGRAGQTRMRVRGRPALGLRATVAALGSRIALLVDRPPHDVEERQDGDLQEDEQIEHRPAHRADPTPGPGAGAPGGVGTRTWRRPALRPAWAAAPPRSARCAAGRPPARRPRRR